MRIADIIEGLNEYFEEKYPDKGFFVHILNVEKNTISKSHKIYTLEIWNINNNTKSKVITVKECGRYLDNEGQLALVYSILTKKLTVELLKYIDSLNNGIQ